MRATGLRILITEHDVDDGDGPADFAARDRAVADASRRFLDVALDNRATMALLTWGLSDRFLKARGLRNTLLRGNPRSLPLDDAMQPTAMRGAIAQALAGARGSAAVRRSSFRSTAATRRQQVGRRGAAPRTRRRP